ncbi:hypothetical protein, partial [Nostoc sp. WHI]|uniref:hypothetical protein n=1 Tax=Nostoc sp. WHI TaxID=2650611 RepID=UPI001E543451
GGRGAGRWGERYAHFPCTHGFRANKFIYGVSPACPLQELPLFLFADSAFGFLLAAFGWKLVVRKLGNCY